MDQALVNGIMLGANYALLAVGYTLVFGVMRLVTLAHGQIFMAAALLALLISESGTPIWGAGLIALAIGAALGLLTNEVCFRPIAHRHEISAAVATIGLGLVIENTMLQARGSSTSVAVPFAVPESDIAVGGVLISVIQLISLFLALALMFGTRWFVHRTKWGMAMRGLAHDPETVAALGIPVRRLTSLTMMIAGGLAAAAAFLLALRNGSVSPLSGLEVGITGLAVMTIGGFGNLRGAMIAGLGLGVLEATAGYVGLEGYQAAVPWALLILVLLVRPSGHGPAQGQVA